MQTYDFFKQVTDLSMPDCDAVKQAILARPAAQKRRFAARYLAAAAAFAVISAAGWAAMPRLFSSAPDPAPLPPDAPVPSVADTAEPPDNAEGPTKGPSGPVESPEGPAADPSEPTEELMAGIRFNALDEESVGPDMALARWIYDNAVEWDLSQVLEYLGRDPLPADLPEGLLPDFDENSRWMYSENDDGSVWAQFGFAWREAPSSEVYNPLERRLDVTVSRSEIFNCGLWMFRDEMQPSTLRGTTLYLGERRMGYGPYTVVKDGPNTPAGYYDVFVAQFEYSGLYYEVTAENLTKEEFVSALASILGGEESAP